MIELIEANDIDAFWSYIVIRIAIVLICWIFMLMACVIDFWSGVSTAKSIGEKIESKGFRRTITKAGDYIKIMLFVLMFDALGLCIPAYNIPFATIICTVAIIAIECKSVIENSRRKKAHAAEVPEVIKEIIKAATTKQGTEVLERILKEYTKR